jgi:hypothetical protein
MYPTLMKNKDHLSFLYHVCKACSLYLCFQMAENGWTQGVCQEEPGFPCLLINSLDVTVHVFVMLDIYLLV